MMHGTGQEPESSKTEIASFETARSSAICLLSLWARTGVAVAHLASGFRYPGVLRETSSESDCLFFSFLGPCGITRYIWPSRWVNVVVDSFVGVQIKDEFGHEYAVCRDLDSDSPLEAFGGLNQDMTNKVRDQLRAWQALQTIVGISVCNPPYDLTFLGIVVDVVDEGCFIENEKKDNLLSLSFKDSICSMAKETIDGVTRLQIELRHLHSGTAVQISEGVHSRKIRRCASARVH